MRILVLNGSPHVSGNTAAMVNAFKEGAESKGHTVEVIQVGTKQVKGCLACEYCHTKGNGKCIQKDDMVPVYEAIDTADMIVFASPVYYFGLSGQMQSVISRFYAYPVPKAKKYALLVSSMSPGVYDGIISQYKGTVSYFGAQDMGIITAHDPENKSAAKLAEVKKLGESL
ncbi:MAG: flavodoxin family protein [Spirochaetia bacterium]|nr:flavodoxin family protein [Spirochaetia bacterium]